MAPRSCPSIRGPRPATAALASTPSWWPRRTRRAEYRGRADGRAGIAARIGSDRAEFRYYRLRRTIRSPDVVDRQLEPEAPGRAWAADIKHISTRAVAVPGGGRGPATRGGSSPGRSRADAGRRWSRPPWRWRPRVGSGARLVTRSGPGQLDPPASTPGDVASTDPSCTSRRASCRDDARWSRSSRAQEGIKGHDELRHGAGARASLLEYIEGPLGDRRRRRTSPGGSSDPPPSPDEPDNRQPRDRLSREVNSKTSWVWMVEEDVPRLVHANPGVFEISRHLDRPTRHAWLRIDWFRREGHNSQFAGRIAGDWLKVKKCRQIFRP